MGTTARIYSHLTDKDVADAVRNLRDEDQPVRGEAEKLAADVLEALPGEVRQALAVHLRASGE